MLRDGWGWLAQKLKESYVIICAFAFYAPRKPWKHINKRHTVSLQSYSCRASRPQFVGLCFKYLYNPFVLRGARAPPPLGDAFLGHRTLCSLCLVLVRSVVSRSVSLRLFESHCVSWCFVLCLRASCVHLCVAWCLVHRCVSVCIARRLHVALCRVVSS